MTTALLVGFSVGLLFSILRLPIPAPPAIEGVLGIVGIWIGYETVRFAPYVATYINQLYR